MRCGVKPEENLSRAIAFVRDAAKQDYRFSAIVSGIIRSDAFRMQAANAEGGTLQASLSNAGSAGPQTTGE